MNISCDTILELYTQRRNAAGPLHERMRQVRDLYNGDVVVPLPELERTERSAVANLTALGLDQMGTRVASVMPDPRYTPSRTGKTEEKAVRDRRRANLGWWEFNRMQLKQRRRGRWLLGYSTAPVIVRPDFKTGVPRWQLVDPLGWYPAPTVDPDDPCVPDGIAAVRRPYGWLCKLYPEQMAVLKKGHTQPKPDTQFDVIEWNDCDEFVVAVVGQADNDDPRYPPSVGHRIVELERFPNRAGRCLFSSPGRINLDRRQGQFDSMLGLHQMQARLMALEVIAVERGIFPDEWLIADQAGHTPEIIQVADGRRGVVGMVKNGSLRQQQLNPGYQTFPTMDRLERAQRLEGSIPAEFGGESQSNVRTGRRGENILSATIDFTIQESQQIFATALEHENKLAVAVDKGWHDTPKSFYVSWEREKGQVDYKPSELFTSDQHVVSYAQAGTDVNGLVISGGQRVGMGTLSKRSFMELDPLVGDAEHESDRIVAEGLEAALLSSIQTMTANGEIPPSDVARIAQLVRDDKKDLADAVTQVQQEAQERQAALVEAQSAAAQPGLAVPGAGAESPAAIPEPAQSVTNLASLMGQLRRPQMTLGSETPLAEAGV